MNISFCTWAARAINCDLCTQPNTQHQNCSLLQNITPFVVLWYRVPNFKKRVRLTGIEPATLSVLSSRSNQLIYNRFSKYVHSVNFLKILAIDKNFTALWCHFRDVGDCCGVCWLISNLYSSPCRRRFTFFEFSPMPFPTTRVHL